MKRVLVFGAFDPLHEGHKDMLRQARALGDYVLVVVARDANVRRLKNREPRVAEDVRWEAVAAAQLADEVMLGMEAQDRYQLLADLEFDILAMGYDQAPDDTVVAEELKKHGKSQVPVIRLKPFKPEVYKSSLLGQ